MTKNLIGRKIDQSENCITTNTTIEIGNHGMATHSNRLTVVLVFSSNSNMDSKPVDLPPHSTENYDAGALLPEQQKRINELKVWFRFSIHIEKTFSCFLYSRFESVSRTNVTYKSTLNWTFSCETSCVKLVSRSPKISVSLLRVSVRTFELLFLKFSLCTRVFHTSDVRKTNRTNRSRANRNGQRRCQSDLRCDLPTLMDRFSRHTRTRFSTCP